MENRRPKEPEEVAEEALKILAERNPLFLDFYHSPKNGDLDATFKIDFLLILANRLVFPLQIKGHESGMKRHYEKCFHVAALCVRKGHDPEKVANKIERLVQYTLRNTDKLFIRRKIEKKPAPQ